MSAKTYPKNVYFLLADDVREEKNNKVSIIGAFTGDDILVHDPQPGKAIPSLALLVIFKNGEGEFDIEMDVLSPSSKKLGKGVEFPGIQMKAGINHSLLIKFPNFVVPEFGVYKFRFSFDKGEKVYEYPVVINGQSVN